MFFLVYGLPENRRNSSHYDTAENISGTTNTLSSYAYVKEVLLIVFHSLNFIVMILCIDIKCPERSLFRPQ